jgi:biopolymer transport protein ExbD
MRRFSQRSSLVTLSEINITPLLDLAFVLLIIFILTTPLLDNQGLKLKLPEGGQPDKPLVARDIRTVEISPTGALRLDRKAIDINQLEQALVRDFKANPNLVVYIRADEMGRNKDLYAVIDRCQRNGITRYSLRTDPTPRKP